MNERKIQSFMQGFGGDWLIFVRNPSAESHIGWVWKIQIYSAYAVFYTF